MRRAWTRVVLDCGCPDLYYCAAGDDIECPCHGGFDTCCDRQDEHIPVLRRHRLLWRARRMLRGEFSCRLPDNEIRPEA
ncbi:hypothetical protein [Parafrankia sp. EUN1f]|uniref:hypothetical protein n=1 Tax=Parafrankia sp. EUN1f TaxID=102897 RepID=UPI00056B4924|nr:hypothetical protein [Parafrankia sp. EUN1f]